MSRLADRAGFESALARCRSGDAAAFAVVYDELVDVVWRVIGLLHTGAQDAEKLALSVFVELWQQVPGYDGATCSPRRWAMNVALDVIERSRDAPTVGAFPDAV